jgi:serine/threonine protein kinase
MGKRPPKPFETVFKDSNPQALDSLNRMLDFNPDKRITVEQALSHPYFSALNYPDDEPITPVSLLILIMRDNC